MAKGLARLKQGPTKKAPTKSRSKTPVIEIDDENIVEAIEAFEDATERKKTAEADIELAKGILLQPFMDARRKHIQDTGAYTKAARVNGRVKITRSKKHSAIPVDREADLREHFGDEKYDKYFAEKTSITLKPELTENEGVLDKLFEVFGEEEFFEVFDVDREIVPRSYEEDVPPLMRDKDLDPKIAKLYDDAVDQELIKPSTPSIGK